MMFTLLARRTEAVEPPAPTRWPEIGETWKPEGVSVVERYANLVGAVVLVYNADSCYHVIACLGCHYLASGDNSRTYSSRYGLKDASKAANEHASICRALPRDIPARPDEHAARARLHTWVVAMSRRDEDRRLHLSDFDSGRLILQRTNEWIETELRSFAAGRPDVLTATPSEYSPSFDYKVLRLAS